MGSLLQIRDVPEGVRRALKARAAAQGVSLNSYLLRLLDRDAARPTAAEIFQRAAQRSQHPDVSAVDVLSAARKEREDELGGPPE